MGGLILKSAIQAFALLTDAVVVDVVFVAHEFVDGAVGREFDDTVGHGVDKLVVVRGEEDVAAEALQVVVESLDGLHVQVVGGGVEDEAVGIAELHACNHAAHLFTSRKDIDFLHDFFVLKEHTSQEGLKVDLIAFSVLREPVEHIEVGVEEFSVVERQIGGGDGDTPREGTRCRLLVAVDNLKESGHGTRVVTDKDDLLFFLHLEAHVVEEHRSVLGHGLEVLDFENLVAGLALHLEDDAGIAAGGRLDFLHIELFEHLLARGGLAAFGHIGREATDELFQFLLLLFGLLTLVLCLTQSELRRLIPEGVVAGEHRHLTEVDVDGVGANLVEEVAVVAHHEDGVFKVAQIVFKPFHSFEVKVVGRFVKEKVVGFTEEGLCQHDTHLLFVGKFAHEFAVEGILDAEAREESGSVIFGRVAADGGKFILEFSHLDAVFVGKIFFGVKFVAFLHHAPQHGVALEHGVEHGLVVKLEVVLGEHGESLAGAQFHRSLCRFEFAADGFEERGLARAVGTNHTIDVAVGKLHVHVLVEHALTKLNSDVRKSDHLLSMG